ncbi:MAG: LPXTG cell wall anchor domain-containing protein [Eubacteriales bacterium]|nr:LPXTG cell wall anchor domain-containing protein [Clostridiales bacterium]MDY5835674.1 LPXTG cell wall anchor domain-containing protein [Eubacteriales bacterium]
MNRNFWNQVQSYVRKARFRRRVRNIFAALAIVTVFVTTYALILPAITLENTVGLPGLNLNEGQDPAGQLNPEGGNETPAPDAGSENPDANLVESPEGAGSGQTGQSPSGNQQGLPDSLPLTGQVSGEFTNSETTNSETTGSETTAGENTGSEASGNETAGNEPSGESQASPAPVKDPQKEPGSHDLSLYEQGDDGLIRTRDGEVISLNSFSEEELTSLQESWFRRVLDQYSIDAQGEVQNALGERIDTSKFPESLLQALRQKAADTSELLPYALKMYLSPDLRVMDGYTDTPVSEDKLNTLSSALRDTLYGFEVNYDARLEVKDRYTASLRAQGLDSAADSVVLSAFPAAEASRQEALAQQAPAAAPLGAPIVPNPPSLDPALNTLAQNPPQPYYFYANPQDPQHSGFIRIAVDAFVGQNVPNARSYNYPTGYLAKLKFAFSTQGAEFAFKNFRIYLKADQADETKGNYTVPGVLTVPGTGGNTDLNFVPKSVQNPSGPGMLYYYDIKDLPVGSTGLANAYISYTNGSLGGNTTIWVDEVQDPNGIPDYAQAQPPQGKDYINIPHVIEPRDQQVYKKPLRNPSFSKNADTKYYVNGLSFSIHDVVTGDRDFFDEYGELYYLHTEEKPDLVVDTLTLPGDLEFRASSLEGVEYLSVASEASIPADIQGLPAKLNMPGTLITTRLEGQRYLVAFMEEQTPEVHYAYDAKIEAGKLVLSSKAWYKEDRSPDRLPIWHSTAPLNYQLGESLVRFKADAEPQEGGPEQKISNEAFYTLNRMDGTTQTSQASAEALLKAKAAHLTLKKTKDPNRAPVFFGEKAGWFISVKNDSTFVYKNLKTLRDELDPNLYLSQDDLYQLFNSQPAFKDQARPTVTIQHAKLVATPQGQVYNATGQGMLDKDAQYHGGDDTPYDGLATTDPDLKQVEATLTLTCEGDQVTVVATSSAGNELARASFPLASFKDRHTVGSFALSNNLSYIVTHWSQYEIHWSYQVNGQNYPIEGGQEHIYTVPTTVKDTFMLLEADRKNYYPDQQQRVSNAGKGDFTSTSTDYTVDNSEAKHDNAKREAALFKGVEQGVKTSGLGSFFVIAQFQGQGAPEVLTITDHVKQDFVSLLVLEADNLDKSFSKIVQNAEDNQNYGLITEPGNYYFRTMAGEKILGEVTQLTEEGKSTWLIKWHFDRETVLNQGQGFDKTIRVFTYVDPAGGHGSSNYINETWMNDHASHRLYDSVQVSPLYNYDKKIVLKKHPPSTNWWDPSTPAKDELTDFTRLVKGQKVLYRLELWGTSGVSLTKDDIFDRLPETPAGFSWGLTNVRFEGTAAMPKDAVNFSPDINKFTISPDKPDGAHQQLRWTASGDLVTFNQTGSAYIYLELTYPGDDATWKKYQEAYGRTGIDNFFHVYEGERSVHHSLAGTQLCQLDKSLIYSNIIHFYNGSEVLDPEDTDPYRYWNSPYYADQPLGDKDREWGDKTSILVYTISLTNPSGDKLYLSDIHDSLPAGFKFSGFVRALFFEKAGNEGYEGYFTRDPLTYDRIKNSNDSVVSGVTYQAEPYLYKYNVGYDGDYTESPKSSDDIKEFTVEQTSTDLNQPVFRFKDLFGGKYTSYQYIDKAIRFQDSKGWYLPPQSALSFSYRVTVDAYAKTSDISTNKASMAYTQVYPDMEPDLPAEGDVKIEANFNNPGQPINPGSHALTRDTNNNYILSSEVTVRRDPTQIGIKKTYTGALRSGQTTNLPEGDASILDADGYYNPQEQLTWSVDLPVESGVVQDWSFTETMEKPYGFDEIRFYPQGLDRSKDINPTSGWTEDLCYIFSFKEKPEGEVSVTLKRPPLRGIEVMPHYNATAVKVDFYGGYDQGTVTKTLNLNGVNEVTFGNKTDPVTPDFTIRLERDSQGNQKLTLTPEKGYFGYGLGFKDYRGYETKPLVPQYPKFLVKTSNHSEAKVQPKLYWNTARLTPTVPIAPAAIAGRYEDGGQPSVLDGAVAPIFGDKGTMSNKSVTEWNASKNEAVKVDGEPNTATGNPLSYKRASTDPTEPTVMTLSDRQSLLRYTLRLKNLSAKKGNEGKIDDLIIIDNLPEPGDNKTWDQTAPRNSQCQIDFAKQTDHRMTVTVQDYDENGATVGSPRTLTAGKDFIIEYSDEKEFDKQDFQNTASYRWYTDQRPTSRAFRLRTLSTSEDAKISAFAVIEINYFAQLPADFQPGQDDLTAWNSFGYSYHIQSLPAGEYLSSEPEPVGVKVPGEHIPSLQKQRLCGNNAFPVDPAEPTAPNGSQGKQITYLFLVLDASSDYTHGSNGSASALAHLQMALKQGTLDLTQLTGKTLAELQSLLGNSLDYGQPGGTFWQSGDTYQLFQVPLAVGQTSATVPMIPTKDPEDPRRTTGITIRRDRTYHIMELMNPVTGRPYVIKADGKIYEDTATEPQDQTFTDNKGGRLDRQYITTTKGNYPFYTWTPNQAMQDKDLSTLTVTATNLGKPWNINLLKTIRQPEGTGDDKPSANPQDPILKGAIFGLYSPLESEAMTPLEVQNLQSKYVFANPLRRTWTDQNNKTYYLKAVSDGNTIGINQPFAPEGKKLTGDYPGWASIQTTSQALKGQLPTTGRFEGLVANEYVLRELRAPDGYKFSTAPIYLQRSTYYADAGVKLPEISNSGTAADNDDAWALVSNIYVMVEVLPETGGIGTLPYLLAGLTITAIALWGLRHRRRRAAQL